jgi:hypothetical protein
MLNSPLAAYTTGTPYRLLTLVPPTDVIVSHVEPDTLVPQVAAHASPATVPELTTTVPVGITVSTVAELDGAPRRLTSQFAEYEVDVAVTTGASNVPRASAASQAAMLAMERRRARVVRCIGLVSGTLGALGWIAGDQGMDDRRGFAPRH